MFRSDLVVCEEQVEQAYSRIHISVDIHKK